jgi:hypothetical protein
MMTTLLGYGDDLALEIHGLRAGVYQLETYHNDPCSENTSVNLASIEITGTGVTQIGSYEDVPVQHVMTDAELVPYVMSFMTDGTSVVNVKFVRGGLAVLNALILSGGASTAFDPDPENLAKNVCLDAELCWTASFEAAQHHVYLGTSFNDVNDATTSSGVFLDTLSAGTECYPLSGLGLDWATTYYWRIDEVNDPCLWKGDVWQFTTNDGNAYDPVPEVNELRVKVDRELSWQPGCGATAHDVYLGTSLADVTNATTSSHAGVQYVRVTMPTTSWDPPGDMEHYTNYYWRVDRVGATTFKGHIWNFRTIVGPTIVRYKFDGTFGEELPSEVYDDTGLGVKLTKYTIDAGLVTYGSSNPRVNTLGTSAEFSPDAALVHIDPCGPDDFDIFRLDYEQYTYELWVKPHSVASDSALLWKGAGWGAYHLVLEEADGDTTGLEVVGHHDPRMTTSADSITIGEWNHIAVVFDLPDWKVYVNSELEDEEWRGAPLPTGNTSPVGIGVEPGDPFDPVDGWFDGLIDELRIANVALGPEDFLSGSGPEYARDPNPENQALDVDAGAPDFALSWTPGAYAAGHDIYFGTSFEAVGEGATPVEPLWGANSWDPGELEFDTTYYWRVDVVNDPCKWVGWGWHFTTANYVVIDNFESYDNDANRIYYTWIDYIGGSEIDLGTEPFSPAHGGDQSMLCIYDNRLNYGGGFYSEVELPFSPAQDLTHAGAVTVLTLYFYGDPGNDAADTEELYVGLAGSYDEVRYSDDHGNDLNDLKKSEWTEWNIPLSDFSGVNPAAVTSLFIGFGARGSATQGGVGAVYFDDIRLYPSRCVPGLLKPDADLNNDCIVDWGDVGVVGAQWLRSDADVTPVVNPGDANLVGHWELEGNADDSTVNNYHGSAEGSHGWITGKIGTGAIDLSGGWVVVEDEGNTPELRPTEQVSVATWIRLDEPPRISTRVVIKGRDDNETYAMEMGGNGGVSFFVRETNFMRHGVDSGDALPLYEWVHVAGTYDGNEITAYASGQVEKTRTIEAIELFADPDDGLGIGGRYGDTKLRFQGGFDDVRIYNRGLTRAEVAWLASEGSGEVFLDSVANLFTGESPETVNIRDVAVVLEAWLEVKLWPQ